MRQRHLLLMGLAAVCLISAVLINDRAGVAGDIAVLVLCLATVWLITDAAVFVVSRAIRRLTKNDPPT